MITKNASKKPNASKRLFVRKTMQEGCRSSPLGLSRRGETVPRRGTFLPTAERSLCERDLTKFVFDALLSARHMTKLRTSSTCLHGLSHKVESPTRPASATLSQPFLIQNCTLSNSQYVIANDYTAGRSVDANRTAGDVTIPNGVEYEVEFSGVVRLESGFKVEKGATFAAFPCKY